MRLGRPVAAATAAVASLALIAAGTAPAGPGGTATTELSAVELAISGPTGSASLGVIDASTFASTLEDVDGQAASAPFASATVTPITGPGGPVGRSQARSDGKERASWPGGSVTELGGPVTGLGATVSPIVIEAVAGARSASGSVEAISASVVGLAAALGVELGVTGVASSVDVDGARATQGLEVGAMEVTIGDLLSADVLAQLPLGDLLAFIDALPVDLPAGVAGIVDQIRAAIAAVVDQLGVVTALAASLDVPLSDLGVLGRAMPVISELQRLLAALDAADLTTGGGTAPLQEVTDGLGAISDQLDAIGSIGVPAPVGTPTVPGVPSVPGVPDLPVGQLSAMAGPGSALACVPDLTGPVADPVALGAAVEDCINTLISDTVGAVTGMGAGDVSPATALADLQTTADEIVATVTDVVDDLVTAIAGLVPLTEAVSTTTLDLGEVVAVLEGILPGIAGTPLVSVGPMTIGVDAVSDGTEAGSSATVLCQPVEVTIVDQALAVPSCADGLDAVAGASALVDEAIDGLAGLLGALPLSEVVQVGDLRVGLFTDLTDEVIREGDVVTATAGITALDLALPSVTVTPEPVTDVLAGLGLPDVLGTVQSVLADALAEVGGLADLAAVTTTLTNAQASLGVGGGLSDLTDQLDALVAGLDLGELGTLESVSTPSVELRVDPVSTASFAAAPGAPAGEADGSPSLPSTGGGLAVLGLLTIAGAAGLRRRG